jgi:hypothetical protein
VPAHDRVRVTSSPSLWRRVFGITLSRAASRARSAQFSFGRRGCRRWNMASWWRRIKISAAFHLSARRDSLSHAATRVIRKKTNRRHMIGDHHGRTAGRATLLVRAVDKILGTHRVRRSRGTPPAGHRNPRAAPGPATPGRPGNAACRCVFTRQLGKSGPCRGLQHAGPTLCRITCPAAPYSYPASGTAKSSGRQ